MQLKLPFCVVYFPFCKKGTPHLLTVVSEWTYFPITLKIWHYKLWIGRVNTLSLFSLQLVCVPEYAVLEKKKKTTNQPKYLRSKYLAIITIESAKHKLTV